MSANRIVVVLLATIAALVAGGFIANSVGNAANSIWAAVALGAVLTIAIKLASRGFWDRAREAGYFYFGEQKEIVLEGKLRFLLWLYYAVLLVVAGYVLSLFFLRLDPLDHSQAYLFGLCVGAFLGIPLELVLARKSDKTA